MLTKKEFLASACVFDIAECCARLEKSYETLSDLLGCRAARDGMFTMLDDLRDTINSLYSEKMLSSMCPKNPLDR